MTKVACSIGVILLLFPSAVATQGPVVDWAKQKTEILRHHRSLIQIDSSNPPGNETLVVNYLKRVFESEGIPVKTFALDPSRANLVARIKGNGSQPNDRNRERS